MALALLESMLFGPKCMHLVKEVYKMFSAMVTSMVLYI